MRELKQVREAHALTFQYCPLDGSREYFFSIPLKELTLPTMATVWTSPWLAANCSTLSYFSFAKCSGCSAVKVKSPSSCLFVFFHLTPSTTAAPPSCLNVLSYVSMWMASSCFRKTLSATGDGWVMSCRPHAHPTPFPGPDVHAQIDTLVPLFLQNDFTHPWPCSNEVWRFCDATGKLTRGTLLSFLVHLLQFFPPWTQLLPLNSLFDL